MKRFILPVLAVPALLASLASAGCGYFTNIPAQITVMDVKPGRVSYEGTNADGSRSTKDEDPSVTLRAEPGSIGATFNSINITYYKIDGTAVGADKLPSLKLGLTFHLESSNFPSNPMDASKPITQGDVGKSLYVGQYTFNPPVLTRHVEEYGAEANGSDGNQAGIFAKVVLNGSDDANFDASVTFFVPIIFSGTPK